MRFLMDLDSVFPWSTDIGLYMKDMLLSSALDIKGQPALESPVLMPTDIVD